MNTARVSALSVVACLWLLAGCSSKPSPAAESSKYSTLGDGRLDGDAFIVTQGAESVKLGLVEVRILPYQETQDSIAKTKARAEPEIANLQPSLNAALKALESATTGYKTALADAAVMESKVNQGLATSTFPVNPDDFKAAIDRTEAAGKAVNSARHRVAEVEKTARGWNSGALYFGSLPPAVASVKTDADGKFSILLGTKATVALAANATRRVGDKTENYYWLIAISLDGQQSKRIFLSNDNLATSDSKDSLVHVVE